MKKNIRLLLRNGANVNLCDNQGKTPLDINPEIQAIIDHVKHEISGERLQKIVRESRASLDITKDNRNKALGVVVSNWFNKNPQNNTQSERSQDQEGLVWMATPLNQGEDFETNNRNKRRRNAEQIEKLDTRNQRSVR